jgi:hypothetical protein
MTAIRPSPPDFRLDSCLSLVLLRAETPAAERWIDDHIAHSDDVRWFDGAMVIPPENVAPLVKGIRADGLEVVR